jgi:hypothetical protein
MYGEAVFVSLIVTLRSVSFEILDAAAEHLGYPAHDLGLWVPLVAFNAGEVGVRDLDGCSESAQAVAVLFAPPSDFSSIGLHSNDSTQRHPTTQHHA